MSARIKIQPWFFKLIEKLLRVENAIVVSSIMAKINRRIITVRGLISYRTVLVATNEVPQKITASSIFK
jgi:hypothetical protein